MKALTIQQPYAALIGLPGDHDDAKRVENRTWPTKYRGMLAIHAGKSRARIGEAEDYGLDPTTFAFGAIVAVARLADCFEMEAVHCGYGAFSGTPLRRLVVPAEAARRRPWLVGHQHCEGPWCWVLSDVVTLSRPIACVGAQGLWVPPREVLAAVQEQAGGLT